MGDTDFAACLGDWTNKVFDVHVVYDRTTFKTIHEYEKPKIDEDDDW
jgi:hypothetical protein